MGTTVNRIFSLALFGILMIAPAMAAPVDKGPVEVAPSGLEVPRFTSLAASEANMRTGPGERYPILWLYQRNDLPVLVTAEFGNWRKVRTSDGTVGWFHSALLSGERTAEVTANRTILRRDPGTDAMGVAVLNKGVIMKIDSCTRDWCKIKTHGYTGWVSNQDIWGVFSGETWN